MKAPASSLSDSALVEELTNLNESLDCLCDQVAEIRGERAMFGDSGPGTQKTLDMWAEVQGRLKELSREWNRRNPPAPAAPDTSGLSF